jgi:hypothetical protein
MSSRSLTLSACEEPRSGRRNRGRSKAHGPFAHGLSCSHRSEGTACERLPSELRVTLMLRNGSREFGPEVGAHVHPFREAFEAETFVG